MIGGGAAQFYGLQLPDQGSIPDVNSIA